MGSGGYSASRRMASGTTAKFSTQSIDKTFTQQKEQKAHDAMASQGITLRESRDGDGPAVPIIIGLDVTGSMTYVPAKLIGEGLPTMVDGIIQAGIDYPQVLFTAIGDHETDRYPLQVGQFEASDELMDKWLTSVYLEGNGGGNRGESYLLAWMFAGMYTAHDHKEKRGRKGYLFTIGDEPCLGGITDDHLKTIMGGGQFNVTYLANELLEMAQEDYHVYHIHVRETGAGGRYANLAQWQELLGDHYLQVATHQEIPGLISEIVGKGELLSDQAEQADDEPLLSQEQPSLTDNSAGDML